MMADVSWKLIFAVVPPVMLAKGQGLVYAPEPMTCGVGENSAGIFEQTNVSWMKRARRNAMFAKYCDWMPGSVRTPDVGALFAQLASVNTPPVKVGHVFVVAVRMSVYGRSLTTTSV